MKFQEPFFLKRWNNFFCNFRVLLDRIKTDTQSYCSSHSVKCLVRFPNSRKNLKNIDSAAIWAFEAILYNKYQNKMSQAFFAVAAAIKRVEVLWDNDKHFLKFPLWHSRKFGKNYPTLFSDEFLTSQEKRVGISK